MDLLNAKYKLQIANAKRWLSDLNRACVIANRWMIFWMSMSYFGQVLISLCVLANSVNLETQILEDKIIRIVGIVAVIVQSSNLLLRAGDRGMIASVVKDNYDRAASMIELKIAEMEVLSEDGINPDEVKTWKDINNYINDIVELSKKWPSRFVVQTEKIDRIQDQISQKMFNDARAIQEQINKN